jgi:hypothetical protein
LRSAGSARLAAIAALALAVLTAVLFVLLRPSDTSTNPGPANTSAEPSRARFLPDSKIEEFRPQVAEFCGGCHALSSPDVFPKAAWRDEVKQGYDFYFESGRSDLVPPQFDRVVAWFRDQAPDEIVIPPEATGALSERLAFRAETVPNDETDATPAVSLVKWGPLAASASPVILSCDMRLGEVRSRSLAKGRFRSRLLASVSHPAHAEPCDLDGDGLVDLVVADLGSFQPADHADGKVILLKRTADEAYEPIVLLEGLGRVADVEPGDFDGDGDTDLVVAEFGWRKTGRILLLENAGGAGRLELRPRELDSRHGTIHVPPVDLDGDGRLDFFALISQEHECVEAYLNQGAGDFRRERVFEANEPAFGSSGIQLVDLDRDGDLDVLYTNGDMADSFYLRPNHSIRWLENRGRFPYVDHLLALMPGVHRAVACDLDGDGDLDIVAGSLIPPALAPSPPAKNSDSLLWLEQTKPGEFTRHVLEKGTCQHAALDVGDFDGDGDIDLAVGTFCDTPGTPALTIWWNLRIDQTAPDGASKLNE